MKNTFENPTNGALRLFESGQSAAARDGRFKVLRSVVLAGTCFLAVAASVHGQTNFGSVGRGSTSTAQSVSVTSVSGGSVSQVKVLTAGVSGLDFAHVSDSCVGVTLSAGGSCPVLVTFTPSAVSLRVGAVVLLDSNNNTLGTGYLTGTGAGALGVFVPGTIVTVAGSGAITTIGDGGEAKAASLRLPADVTEDGAGNLYIADSDHNRIRKVTLDAGSLTGIISTIANTSGLPGGTGDGGLATAATMINPSGVALDSAGNIYVADTGNNIVRKIDAFTGIIRTIAGNPNGTAGSTGDNGPATAAYLNAPAGVTIDTVGNVYIADTLNQRIRMVNASTGIITSVAGNGQQGVPADNVAANTTPLSDPYTVAFDTAGNMYIPDSGNNQVEKVSGGIIVRVAGTGQAGRTGDGGPALQARMHSPTGVVVDEIGNLYIADTQNSAIRKVTASTGNIAPFAGTYTPQLGGDNGSADLATMYGPSGLYLDAVGNLVIADVFDNRIREVESDLATVKLTINPVTPIRVGGTSTPQPKIIENIGNATLGIGPIAPQTDTAVDGATTTCMVSATSLPVGGDCIIGAEFAPTTVADPLTGFIDVTATTPISPLVIQVIGDAVAQESTTTTTVSSSQNPSLATISVMFTAVVTGQAGVPTGTVSFTSDGAVIGTAQLDANGTATISSATLAIGTHAIVASYGGDSINSTSDSAALSQVVNAIPTVTVLSGTITFATPPQTNLSATVVGTSGPVPTGTVQFNSGTTLVGTVALDATGVAKLTPTLAAGTYSIVAVYSGDAVHSPSTSQAVSITVSTLPSSFTLTTTPSAVTLKTKQNSTITVTLGSVSGFSDTIGFGCGTLPAVVTCHFSEPTVALASDKKQTVKLTIDTNSPLSGGTTASNVQKPSGLYAAGIFLPVGGIFGLLMMRKRKRATSLWAALIFLCLTGAAMMTTGCGGFTQESAKPGTYTIQVTGVGSTTGATSFQNITLTITQ